MQLPVTQAVLHVLAIGVGVHHPFIWITVVNHVVPCQLLSSRHVLGGEECHDRGSRVVLQTKHHWHNAHVGVAAVIEHAPDVSIH